ncbi:MAG: hypothetical protein HC819_09795 [Cyclobacteriaceae bacterium]|nr:hypothetical protein [Cyclobacteriaceae bacterium]
MQDQFQLHFERSGGFAAIMVQVAVRSDSLDAKEAHKVASMIENCQFFDGEIPESKPSPDQFYYVIRVLYRGQEQEVSFTDAAMPERYRPLVHYLSLKAREKK